MAKKTNSYAAGAWDLKKKAIDDFRPVTEQNRKQAVVIGRILYIISKNGTSFTFRGTIAITPCFDKGWHSCPFMPWMQRDSSHYNVFFDTPTNREDWVSSHKSLLDKFISENSLYIKPTDPILTYKKNNT